MEIPKTVTPTPGAPGPAPADALAPLPADPLAPLPADPLAPTAAQTALDRAMRDGEDAVAPMPHDGPPGFFGGVPYLFAVIGARSKHQKAIRSLQRQTADEQHKLDEILRDLGKRARDATLEHGATDGAMTELRALEGKRAVAQQGLEELEQQLEQEQQVFEAVETDCGQRTEAARQEAASLQSQLDEKNGQLRDQESKLAQEDKQLRTLVKQRDDKRNQANKTADAAQQEVLQRAVADLGVQIGDWEKHRETTQAEIDALRPPIESLQAQLREARLRIQQAQKELGAARQTLAAKKREIDGAKRQRGVDLAGLDRQIAEKLLAVGQALDGDRIAAAEFDGLYDQSDVTRARIEQVQQRAAFLTEERDNYDKLAYRNGLIVVAGGAGLLLVAIVLLVVLLS
jgi:chromosome segregation ATPase